MIKFIGELLQAGWDEVDYRFQDMQPQEKAFTLLELLLAAFTVYLLFFRGY